MGAVGPLYILSFRGEITEFTGAAGHRYDANNNGVIDRDEVIAAIFDYFDDLISKDEVLGVTQLYFSS